jgi:hypothetical protein
MARAMQRCVGVQTAASVVWLIFWQINVAAAQPPELHFRQLPNDVRTYVEDVRKSCTALDPSSKPYDAMQGISVIDLDGDGSRDLLVDAEQVCNSWLKGGNCSNRGCDLKIWKQTGRHGWRKIFDEHLYRKFISLSEDRQIRLMAVSVYAGDPHCEPVSGKEYTAGQSCDALIFYADKTWRWEKIE